jgi:putative NADH-flavin reductase
MPGSKVLILGSTGPAGICLLRELIYRNHQVVAYTRSPNKIPKDILSSHLIEVSCCLNSQTYITNYHRL